MMNQQNPEQPSQPIVYDVRFLCAALQQLQVLFGSQPTVFYDPSLADIVHLIHSAQVRFGEDASLEQVIQSLVAEDIARQRTLIQDRRQASVVACQSVSIFTNLPEVLASRA
jgi:hypothetical protein